MNILTTQVLLTFTTNDIVIIYKNYR